MVSRDRRLLAASAPSLALDRPDEPDVDPALAHWGHPVEDVEDWSVSAVDHADGVVVVAPVGEIDALTGPALARCLDQAMSRPGCRRLVIDLSGVTFLGARGVAVLEHTRTQTTARQVRLVLAAPTRAVTRVLGLTGTSGRIDMVPAVPEC